jgi:hypothetical protein
MRAVSAPIIALLLLAAGCGDDGGSESVPTTEAGATAPAVDDAAPGPADTDADDPANPWVLGYSVRGEAGAQIEVEVVAYYQGEAQPAFTQRPSLTGDPVTALFTGFVEAAELQITVVEGGPVTVDGVRGRFLDPEDPFGGVEVREVLSSVEVVDTATLEIP